MSSRIPSVAHRLEWGKRYRDDKCYNEKYNLINILWCNIIRIWFKFGTNFINKLLKYNTDGADFITMRIRILFTLFQCTNFSLSLTVIIIIIFGSYEEKYIRKHRIKNDPRTKLLKISILFFSPFLERASEIIRHV